MSKITEEELLSRSIDDLINIASVYGEDSIRSDAQKRHVKRRIQACTAQQLIEARIDELEKAINDYGLSEGVSHNSTPVVTFADIRKRIAQLKQGQSDE